MNRYTEQIERLTKNPTLIFKEWDEAEGIFARICSRGCPTQIRSGFYMSEPLSGISKLDYDAIRNDERIPINGFSIGIGHLSVFEEWQLKIDALKEQK